MGQTFLSPAEFIADLANPALSFLPNALMIAVLGAVICGVVGTHVTLRGMAFLGDAVAHGVFPGLAIAFALQVSVLLGGAVAGVVIALLIAVFSQRRRVKEDTVIGIFFAASFALGLVIIAQIDGYTASLTSFLFGSITGVARSDIYIVALGGAVIMAVLWLFHSRLVAVSLDRETARAMGLNVLALDMLLYVCVTMAVVMSVRTVGNILVLALLITPAATARLLTERVVTMMWVSALIGAVGAVLGVYISWAADVPTGATIVLVLTAMFIFSFLVSPRHGVVGRGRRGSVAQVRTSAQSRTAGRRVVGAAVSVIALLGAVVAIPASSGWLPTAVAQESDAAPEAEKSPEKPQHNPGDASDNPTVPKDAIDPRTGKTHVCAGKKLLYQAHVDALYGTYRDGKLAVMVVDGMAVANPEDVCIRLAPDADTEGKEVSRLVVPEGEAFSFLGKPGDILWHAPQQVDTWNGWRPVWAGAGAFDPHHEYEVPQNFVNDEVKFSLVGADKPGNMEMFFYSHALKETENYISTENGPTHFTYEVGAHGHFGWTFSKAGRYTLTWQVSTETTDGKKLVSEPTPITWLVGSDEEVGLPEGTTKNLNPIKKSAEDQREELFPNGAGSDAEDGRPGDSENPGGTNPGTDAPGDNGGGNGEQTPDESAPGDGGTVDPDHKPIPGSSDRVSIGRGHMDLAFSHKPGEGDVQNSWGALLIDGQNPSKLVNRPSGSFEFVIDSDRAKVSTPEVLRSALKNGGKEYGDKLWQIPQTQQEAPDVPWLGFNTEGANYGKLSKDGVKVGLKEFDGPGRMVTARGGIGQFDVLLDSANLDKKITFRNPTHDHQAFMFSAPGRYRAVFEFQATTASGEKVSKELEAYFLVAPNEMSSGGDEGSPGDGPGAGSGNSGGSPGADAGDTGGDGGSIGDHGGGSGGVTGDSNNKLVGILNGATGIVDSLDTGVGYVGEILKSIRGIAGLSSTESGQPEVQPDITPGDAHAGDENGAGAATGAVSAAAAGGAGHGGTTSTAGGAVTGGLSSSTGSHSSGASAGSGGTSALSSSGASSLALDAIDADGGDAVGEDAEEELDGDDSEDAAADSEYRDSTREGSADREAAKDPNAEPESKAIQLANALGQGGWIGGLMFGMGGMALLGGVFFAFIAWRLMRNNAAKAGHGSAEGEASAD